MKNPVQHRVFRAILPALLASSLWLHPQITAATIRTVTNLNDSGPGSLRVAMTASGTGDTIDFTNTLTGTILLASSLPLISTNLTIINTNVQSVSIWGNGHDIFTISGGTVTLAGLIIRDGSFGNVENQNHGTVTINDCVLADALSAGIFNMGNMAINRCHIHNNIGGIYNQGTSLIINESTISDNDAGTAGASGGIYNVTSLSMTNCTVSRNATHAPNGGTGGGIGLGNVTLNSCTICSNTSAGPNGLGGGLYTAGGTVVLVNTIIFGNTATGSGPDVYGAVTSQGYNLIGATNNSSGWIASDLKGSDPKLGPLQNNGGLTLTHALLPASPAIDAGNGFGLAADQRGRQRPYNRADAAGGDGSDIGAYEFNPPVLNIAPIGNSVVLSWATYETGFTHTSNTNLLDTNWASVSPPPTVVGTDNVVTNTVNGLQKYYRLMK